MMNTDVYVSAMLAWAGGGGLGVGAGGIVIKGFTSVLHISLVLSATEYGLCGSYMIHGRVIHALHIHIVLC